MQVKKGTSLTFVNEDAALGIRHTVTTCAWPCNGPYVANFCRIHPWMRGAFEVVR